jgi:antitoxin MazE
MRAYILKRSNSHALHIPKLLAGEVGLERESPVEVSLAEGKLVIAPVAGPKLSLKQLLAKVTKNNLHREAHTGPATGNETW